MLIAIDAHRREVVYMHAGAMPAFELEGRTAAAGLGMPCRQVDPAAAEILAKSGSLTCLDPDCTRGILFRKGGYVNRRNARSGERAATWIHEEGAGPGCSTSGAGVGVWHRHLTDSVMGSAAGHEVVLGTSRYARADVVVEPASGRGKVAVEVQASPIAPATVIQRNAVHAASGMAGTIWLVNGQSAGFPTEVPGWGSQSCETVTLNDQPLKGSAVWLLDVVRACLSGNDSGVARVGVVLGPEGNQHVRFIESAAIGREPVHYKAARKNLTTVGAPIGGYLSLRVKGWSAPVSMKELGDWAAGRSLNTTIDGALRSRPWLARFDGRILVSKDGERVRLFVDPSTMPLQAPWVRRIIRDAEGYGLEFTAPGPERTRAMLTGELSPAVQRWLFVQHGWLAPETLPVSDGVALAA